MATTPMRTPSVPVVAVRVAILLALVICSRASVADPPTPSANNKGFRFADVDAQSLGLWEGDRPVFVYNHGTKSRSDVPNTVGAAPTCIRFSGWMAKY